MNVKDNEISGKILVLGGAGFIGSHFVRLITSEFPNFFCVNFDALKYSGNLENLKDVVSNNYRFIKGDICNIDDLSRTFDEFNPDYVINFAAESHVDNSIHGDASAFVNTNVVGVFNILEQIRKRKNIRKFLQVSTDEVYGDLPIESDERFTPDTPLRPNSLYASSKAQADLMCRAYFKTFKVPVVITRCGNNYGTHQYPEKLIPFFILRLLEGKKLPLYGNGQNIRDWVHVIDHAKALSEVLFSAPEGSVYNIGADCPRSNLDVAKRILKHFDADESMIEYVTDRPAHDAKYHIDASLLEKELGFKAEMKFDDSIDEVIQWYIENRSWIDDILSQSKLINKHIVS